jgi:hypothetical protein
MDTYIFSIVALEDSEPIQKLDPRANILNNIIYADYVHHNNVHQYAWDDDTTLNKNVTYFNVMQFG